MLNCSYYQSVDGRQHLLKFNVWLNISHFLFQFVDKLASYFSLLINLLVIVTCNIVHPRSLKFVLLESQVQDWQWSQLSCGKELSNCSLIATICFVFVFEDSHTLRDQLGAHYESSSRHDPVHKALQHICKVFVHYSIFDTAVPAA